MMISENEITIIGKFQKTHALKGELNAILDIDSDYITEGHALIVELDGIYVPFFASGVRPKGATSFLVKLDGVDSEEEAKKFVNKTIYALKSELAPFLDLNEEDLLDEDDFLDYRILDLATNQTIGKIVDVDMSTSNVLFIVNTPEGDTVYIPAAEEFISEIDDTDRVIRMMLPEGLININ